MRIGTKSARADRKTDMDFWKACARMRRADFTRAIASFGHSERVDMILSRMACNDSGRSPRIYKRFSLSEAVSNHSIMDARSDESQRL